MSYISIDRLDLADGEVNLASLILNGQRVTAVESNRKRKTRIHRIMDIVFFVICTRVLDDESPVAECG